MKTMRVAAGWLVVLAQFAVADVSGSYGYTVSGGQATITNYTGAGGNVAIPATLGGQPVAIIGYQAFRNQAAVTGVTLPDSVTGIEMSAFSGCTGLTNLNLGTGLVRISHWAFSGCSALPGVTIPGSVVHIDTGAFNNCRALTNVTLQEGVRNIGPDVFYGCSNLPALHLPASLTNFYGGALGQCYRLSSLTVAAGNPVYKIVGGVLFSTNGTRLVRYPPARAGTTYSIPNGVVEIEEEAFQSCGLLTGITVPAGVTRIRNAVFWECTGLTRVDLPDSVVAIESNAFRSCTVLANVLIGSGVETIGRWAFAWNPALAGVHFAGNAPEAHAEAFLESTPTVYYRAGTTGWGATLAGRPTALWALYPAPMHQAWDDGYTDLGGGWRRLTWFGDYIPMGDWIFHNQHGFWYPAANSTPPDIWFFTQDMGWLWTGNATYPFLYRASDGAWLWYNGAVNPRWFRNMTAGTWESRP